MAKISSPELYVPSEAEANGYKKAVLEGKHSFNSYCLNFPSQLEINCSCIAYHKFVSCYLIHKFLLRFRDHDFQRS